MSPAVGKLSRVLVFLFILRKKTTARSRAGEDHAEQERSPPLRRGSAGSRPARSGLVHRRYPSDPLTLCCVFSNDTTRQYCPHVKADILPSSSVGVGLASMRPSDSTVDVDGDRSWKG